MDLIPFFSTVILVATIASIVLAIGSYLAYKERERRGPNREFHEAEQREAVFFHRYDPVGNQAAGRDDEPLEVQATGTDNEPVDLHDAGDGREEQTG